MIQVETISIEKRRDFTCNACVTGVASHKIVMGDPNSKITFSVCRDCREELNLQLVIIINE